MKNSWLGQLIFAILAVGTLAVIRLGKSAGLLYRVLGICFQLVGGTIFAVGLFGDHIKSIQAWVEKYLIFTSEPIVSLTPLIIIVNFLALAIRGKNQIVQQVVDFIGYGVVVILTVTVFAQWVKLPRLLSAIPGSWLRVMCCVLGATLYWFGLIFYGNN